MAEWWLNSFIEQQSRWGFTQAGPPFADATCAWVVPVLLADGSPAVWKVQKPHMEGEQEIDGLRFWDGEPTVRLIASDQERRSMLLERCFPGTSLRRLSEPDQDLVIADLLRRLWRRVPADPNPFRDLAVMLEYWSAETLAQAKHWCDPGLVREGLSLFLELGRTAPRRVLLATDLHAGNVLRGDRERWLVIDPKPFLGDPAFDVTHTFSIAGPGWRRTRPDLLTSSLNYFALKPNGYGCGRSRERLRNPGQIGANYRYSKWVAY